MSVISGSSLQVVASVEVGANPVGVAADPISGQVFVVDAGDSNVTIFNASSYGVITNVTVGSVPYGIAIDPVSDTAYVTNSASVNVTVLSASTDSIVAWITVPGGLTYPPNDLSGLAYDSQDGLVFVGAGYHDMLVLNTSTLSVEAVLGTDPAGVVYNPDTGDVCVTNTDNNTFECLLTEVSFTETGLLSGAEWTVNVTPSIAGPPSTSNVLDFQVPIFTSFNYTVLATGGNEPTPASGTEIGLDQWQSQEISISFSPGATSYWANFTESGLPSGGGWSVDLDGLRDSGTLATIGFLVPNGTYPFYVANTLVNGTQYTPSLSSGTVYVNGSDFLVGFTFQTSTPTPADYPVTFQESGLPNGTAWSGSVGSWVFLNQTVPTATLGLPNGTYAFTIGNVSGFSASPSSGSLTVDGASVTENITFTSTAVVPRYLVGFQEYGLPAGTSWNATLGGMTRNSTGLWINFTASNGTYTFDVPAVTGYAANSSAGNLTVQGRSVTVTLTFSPVPFPVEFTESGLAAGSNWTVVATNRANNASVTGTRSTATITLSLVEGTYAVTATGPAGPHPSMYSTSLVVGSDGAGPVMILLGPVVCACGEVGVPGPPLQLYLLVGAIVAVGAVVAGMILVRTRRPPPEPPLDPDAGAALGFGGRARRQAAKGHREKSDVGDPSFHRKRAGAPRTYRGLRVRGRSEYRSRRESGRADRAGRAAQSDAHLAPAQERRGAVEERSQRGSLVHPLEETERRHREDRDALRPDVGGERLGGDQLLGAGHECLGRRFRWLPDLEEREAARPSPVEDRVCCGPKSVGRGRDDHGAVDALRDLREIGSGGEAVPGRSGERAGQAASLEDVTGFGPFVRGDGIDGPAPDETRAVPPIDQEGGEVDLTGRGGEPPSDTAVPEGPREQGHFATGGAGRGGRAEEACELVRGHPGRRKAEAAQGAGGNEEQEEVLGSESFGNLRRRLHDIRRTGVPGKSGRDNDIPEREFVRDRLGCGQVPLGETVAEHVQGGEGHRAGRVPERDERHLAIPVVGDEPVADAQNPLLAPEREPDRAVGVGRRHGGLEGGPVDRVRPLRLRSVLGKRLPRELADHDAPHPVRGTIR